MKSTLLAALWHLGEKRVVQALQGHQIQLAGSFRGHEHEVIQCCLHPPGWHVQTLRGWRCMGRSCRCTENPVKERA